jgi:hypothetical protein
MSNGLLDDLPELDGQQPKRARSRRKTGVIYLPPPLKCPWCGASEYEQYGTPTRGNVKIRYYFCKKSSCGRKFQTHQPLR